MQCLLRTAVISSSNFAKVFVFTVHTIYFTYLHFLHIALHALWFLRVLTWHKTSTRAWGFFRSFWVLITLIIFIIRIIFLLALRDHTLRDHHACRRAFKLTDHMKKTQAISNMTSLSFLYQYFYVDDLNIVCTKVLKGCLVCQQIAFIRFSN